MACSCGNTCSNCRKKGGRAIKKQAGGYLQGPSHEQGGIPANIQNGEQVELEGGEYIIRKDSVNAETKPILEKINKTGKLPKEMLYDFPAIDARKRKGGK